jgi:hypothetical protein
MVRLIPMLLCLLGAHCTVVTSILSSDLSDASTEAADAGLADGATAPVDAADALPCPANYLEVGNTCHRHGTVEQDWFAAQADCVQDAVGAHLVIVDDQSEYDALPDRVWIGLYEHDSQANFLTVTNVPPPFLPWAQGQPAAGGGLCGESRLEGWHDDDCNSAKNYVCEFDGVAADTPYLP